MISFQTIRDKFSGWFEVVPFERLQITALNEFDDEFSAINLVGSQVGTTDKHRVCVDIDFPVELHPSRTPGHYHLYLTGMEPVEWSKYEKLLDAMVECGILEPGYVAASKARKNTFLRARPDVVLASDDYKESLLPEDSIPF